MKGSNLDDYTREIPDDWAPGPVVLPISYWTKARIIEEAEKAGVCERIILALADIRLSELRLSALEFRGAIKTGKLDNPSEGRWRHTKLYSLDIGWISSLGAEE